MSNKHTIELSLGTVQLDKDTTELLGTMLQALTYITVKLDNIEAAMQTSGTPFQAVSAPEVVEPAEVEKDAAQEENAAPVEAEPVAEPEAPKYTKADIMALVQRLAAPTSTKREQAKAIVKGYATRVSDIPEDKYTEVMDKLTKLEQED